MNRLQGSLAWVMSISVILLLGMTATYAAVHVGDIIFVVAVLLGIGGLLLLTPMGLSRSARHVTVRRRRARVRTAIQLEASLRVKTDAQEPLPRLAAPGPTAQA